MGADTPPRPHHTGHRERLRERARGAGLPTLPDYELLELFLFRSQPQGDVKPIAKALLTRFASLAAVPAASGVDMRPRVLGGTGGLDPRPPCEERPGGHGVPPGAKKNDTTK